MNVFNIAIEIYDIVKNVAEQIYKALFTSASDFLNEAELPGVIEDIISTLVDWIGDFTLLGLFVRLAIVSIILTFVYRLIGRF